MKSSFADIGGPRRHLYRTAVQEREPWNGPGHILRRPPHRGARCHIVPDQNELTLEIEVMAEVATVRCTGGLTLTSASRFRHEVKRLLSQARVVIIDLTGLTMMDSVGLGTIASLYASARSAGRRPARGQHRPAHSRDVQRLAPALAV